MKKPKILFFDLETNGVGALNADLGWIVCFGYKFLGDKQTRCLVNKTQDDSKILKVAQGIFENADLIVAHYGERFDRKFVNARLLKARLKPIPNTKLCDTWRIAKTCLKLSSNRLANIAQFLDVPVKKMVKGRGWPDWWHGAMRGDAYSIKQMVRYCKQDVDCLEAVFKAMGPIIPAQYLVTNEDHQKCIYCHSGVAFRGSYRTTKNIYRRYQCKQCGKWGYV